jgi:uncharacterized protein YndB with AHSA1/START domain
MRAAVLADAPLRRMTEVITLLIPRVPMDGTQVIHNTFVLEQTCLAAPGRVFAAFADPERKRGWFAESPSHAVESFEMDFRVGGLETARYRFTAGGSVEGVLLTSEAAFLDVQPDRRIVSASTMALGGQRISASLVTITLAPSEAGTHLTFTHQGAFLAGADGPEMRKARWRQRLDRLNRTLVQ